MGSEEVGVLRKLGKHAVWLLRRMSAGEVIDGAIDEPDVDAEEDGEEEGDEEEEEEKVEAGADFLDTDDGYSLSIDPIKTAASAHGGNSGADQIATKSETDLVEAKQRVLNSLDTKQGRTDPTETNANSGDDVRRLTPMDGEGGLKESADGKVTIHATLDMLITIIGEFYGQKDLLNGRLLWDEMQ